MEREEQLKMKPKGPASIDACDAQSQPKRYWDIEMLKDFFDPTDKVRRVGRTETLAQIFIELAKENPECKIRVIDHAINHPEANKELMTRILRRIVELNEGFERKNHRCLFIAFPNQMEIVYTYHKSKYFVSYDEHVKRDYVKFL